MPDYLRPYVEGVKKLIKKKEVSFQVFKKHLIDYKANFISYTILKYFIMVFYMK